MVSGVSGCRSSSIGSNPSPSLLTFGAFGRWTAQSRVFEGFIAPVDHCACVKTACLAPSRSDHCPSSGNAVLWWCSWLREQVPRVPREGPLLT